MSDCSCTKRPTPTRQPAVRSEEERLGTRGSPFDAVPLARDPRHPPLVAGEGKSRGGGESEPEMTEGGKDPT